MACPLGFGSKKEVYRSLYGCDEDDYEQIGKYYEEMYKKPEPAPAPPNPFASIWVKLGTIFVAGFIGWVAYTAQHLPPSS